jgi:hypothetical protein
LQPSNAVLMQEAGVGHVFPFGRRRSFALTSPASLFFGADGYTSSAVAAALNRLLTEPSFADSMQRLQWLAKRHRAHGLDQTLDFVEEIARLGAAHLMPRVESMSLIERCGRLMRTRWKDADGSCRNNLDVIAVLVLGAVAMLAILWWMIRFALRLCCGRAEPKVKQA